MGYGSLNACVRAKMRKELYFERAIKKKRKMV